MPVSNLPGYLKLDVLLGDILTWEVTLLDEEGGPMSLGTTWDTGIYDDDVKVADLALVQASNVLTFTLSAAESSKLGYFQSRYHWEARDLDNDQLILTGFVGTDPIGLVYNGRGPTKLNNTVSMRLRE